MITFSQLTTKYSEEFYLLRCNACGGAAVKLNKTSEEHTASIFSFTDNMSKLDAPYFENNVRYKPG
jgi:hypothetical protein